MFISWISCALKSYSIVGVPKLSKPNIIPPTINCISIIEIIIIATIIKHVINLEVSIVALLYGLTSKSFIVPLLNSSLTIVPAIITIIITINIS